MTPDPTEARRTLAALEQRARKRFGQHFLVDGSIVERIVRGARVTPGERVIEVGPGLGVLTRALVAAGAQVTAVELDRDLVAYLTEAFPEVRLVSADATKVDWPELVAEGGAKVVANLPYNVGTTLTMQLVRRPELFTSITVMLQLEVVQRLCAEPGNKTYGALSVELQARARPTFLLLVSPDRFHPRPKVDSAVVRLDLHPEPLVGAAGAERFDAVVRAAFSQRRKTALNALGAVFPKPKVAEALEAVGVRPLARAEQLDLATFRALAEQLAGVPRGGSAPERR